MPNVAGGSDVAVNCRTAAGMPVRSGKISFSSAVSAVQFQQQIKQQIQYTQSNRIEHGAQHMTTPAYKRVLLKLSGEA